MKPAPPGTSRMAELLPQSMKWRPRAITIAFRVIRTEIHWIGMRKSYAQAAPQPDRLSPQRLGRRMGRRARPVEPRRGSGGPERAGERGGMPLQPRRDLRYHACLARAAGPDRLPRRRVPQEHCDVLPHAGARERLDPRQGAVRAARRAVAG